MEGEIIGLLCEGRSVVEIDEITTFLLQQFMLHTQDNNIFESSKIMNFHQCVKI